MSSDESSSADLKAGHAPAVKVGNMRVVQHKKESDKSEPTPLTPEEEEEYGSPPKVDKHNQTLLVSGALTKGDKDYTPEAVKSFHEKPVPTHDVKPRPQQQSKHINQPR